MSFRVFNSIDMVVILNDNNWDVEKFEKGGMWYAFNNLEAPILYSIYQRSPERPLILDQPFTAFKDKKGNGFDNDIALQEHLDEVLAAKELEVKLETIPLGKNNLLATRDQGSVELLKEIVIQLRINNLHLSLINDETFKEKDL